MSDLRSDLDQATPLHGLRFRAVLIGIPIIVALSFVTVYGDMVVQSIQIGILQLPPPALGGLFLLAVISRLVRWAIRKQFLGSQDLFPLYVMMTVTVLMCSRGTIEKLIPPLIHTNYYATAENKYSSLFSDYTPKWLVAFDPKGDDKQEIAKAYHEGNAPVKWRHWLGPILSWTGLLSLIYTSFMCLSIILRRQWADNEKLVFPLVTLPLAVIQEETSTSFLSNRLTWLGVAIPVLFYGINALHANISAVPELTLAWNLNQFLTARPWNGIYYTRLVISFAAIGFFYFLASDLLFSLWFFFVMTRLTDIIGTHLGCEMMAMPLYPTRVYIGYQVMGAYFVLVVYLLRSGWLHYGPVVRNALRRLDQADDGPNREVLPYRTAFWGLLLSTAGAIAWCYFAGLEIWLAAVEILVYIFVVALVLSRGVAEAGLLQTEASFRPLDVVKLFRPHYSLGSRNITMLSMLDTMLTRDLRGVLLSNFLDDQKMAHELRFRPRSLLVPVLVTVPLALACGCYYFLTISHDMGQIAIYSYPRGNAEWHVQEAATAILQQQRTPVEAVPAALIGTAVCSLLVFLRTTVVWWPLHPLAYAVCGSWTMLVFWFSAFLTWLAKGLILKSGGMKLYRQLMPFFLGLVLGTFLMAFALTMVVFVGRLYGVMIMAPSLGFD